MSIVALLSADSIFINSTTQRQQAESVRSKFISSEGDHMALLNIFRAFKANKSNKVSISLPFSEGFRLCFIWDWL